MDAKRLFDLTFSALGLLVLFPVLVIISFCILFESGRPIIYRQKRLGKDWKHFILYKFRTMNFQMAKNGPDCTSRNDKRITEVGKHLRKYKLDEFPQLFNVLKGDMSFVGPRPELAKFVYRYSQAYDKILRVKPGITDLASIKFRNESSLLNSDYSNIEEFYVDKILPRKLIYNIEYLEKQEFLYDLGIILKTLYIVFFKSKLRI